MKLGIKQLGPGLIFASTAIGVSHLVQSTQAGATYGYSLVWAIILANLFKYPFFEMATRYTSVTGKSLLDGYYQKSKWILVAFLLLTILTMFTVSGAVSFVTAAILSQLLGWSDGVLHLSLILFVVCVVLLVLGGYALLEKSIKWIAGILLLSTLVVFIITFFKPIETNIPYNLDVEPLFLIALMGWMPTALDISVWSSLWTEERMHSDKNFSLKRALLDFRVGYIITAVLALIFMVIGARVMYVNQETFPANAAGFAQKLISLYTQNLGEWSFYFIAAAAFSIMFSTTYSVLDGYSRTFNRSFSLLFRQPETKISVFIGVLITAFGGYVVISLFQGSLKELVRLATVLSFLTAPLIGVLNFILIRGEEMSKSYKTSTFFLIFSLLGIVFLVGFSVYFLLSF